MLALNMFRINELRLDPKFLPVIDIFENENYIDAMDQEQDIIINTVGTYQ
ncbi:unnamed protein product [uncultured virus]|nr:unnamed protein product [uncultured virus]